MPRSHERYDAGKVGRLVVNGDGADWVKAARAHFEGAEVYLDPYHRNEALRRGLGFVPGLLEHAHAAIADGNLRALQRCLHTEGALPAWLDICPESRYPKYHATAGREIARVSLLAPIQVGRLTIACPLALAPMAGVTSWPFRLLCKEQGCGIAVTEFVNDRAILSGNQHTWELVRLLDAERPAGVQIFGHNPETMAAAAAAVVERVNPDFLDINMGCPAPKITNGLGGSALLRQPDLASAIVRVVGRAIAPVPVTVKMRIGWDQDSVNAVTVARQCEDAGVAMITVHGRTREQRYSGESDWSVIAAVARAVKVPVLGNGDITDPTTARLRLLESGVKGLAIGRAAWGRPWLFNQILHYFESGELLPDPDIKARIELALLHLKRMVEYQGEYVAVREMRKHAARYIHGLSGAAECRQRINQAESQDEMAEILWSLEPGQYRSALFSGSGATACNQTWQTAG